MVALDIVLRFRITAGYLILLFGALRAAGWARIGSRVVAVAAKTPVVVLLVVLFVVLLVVLLVVPTGPLIDIDLSQRIIDHGLIIVGAIVAALASVIERSRQPMLRP